METNSCLKMQVALTMLPRFNTQKCLTLIEQCGGIEGFFHEKTAVFSALLKTYHLDCADERKKALRCAEEELKNLDIHDIQVCSIEHSNYPFLLRECEDTPLVFYYKGQLVSEDLPYLSIVGTRHASDRCKIRVRTILKELSEKGHRLIIVSGLAYGIDITAHLSSLAYNFPTYAVLGHGLNTIYPAPHKNIAEDILRKGGALISEYPCSSPILPVHFLKRNRIIAGISQATFVAESALKGGAMSTARIAASYGRDILALPGRPEDKFSEGCNHLIKQNIAALVENSSDIAFLLHLKAGEKTAVQTRLDFFESDDQEKQLLKVLTQQGCTHIDDLGKKTNIAINALTALLLKLELEGKIISLPGKNYIIP